MPITVDPVLANETNGQFIITNSFDGLVSWDEEQGLQPQLAKRWEFSQNRNEVTFFLRQDVKFSDGSSFTSENVKYHFDRLKKSVNFASNFEIVKDVQVIDGLTVKFLLAAPDPYFLQLLSGTHSRIVKTISNAVVGIGPFSPVLEKNRIELNLNSNYWGAKPKVKKIILKVVKSEEANVELALGILDDIIIFPSQLGESKSSDLSFKVQYMWATWAIIFDQRVLPFNRKEIRKQIASQLTTDEFQKIFPGNSKAFGIQARGMPGFLEESVGKVDTKSHYNKKIKLNINIPAEVEKANEIVKWINEKKFDCCFIHAILVPFEKIMGGYAKGKMGSTLISLNAEYADPTFLMKSLKSNSSNNFLGVKSKAYDDLIEKIDSSEDTAEKSEVIKKLNTKLMSDAALIPLMHVNHKALFRSCVSGITLSPLSEGYFSLRNVINTCK